MTNEHVESAITPYVVLDSNVWIKELALQSAKASAVRYFLKTGGAKLVVPEVVRLEVEGNLRQKMIDCREEIRRAHRELLQLFGSQKEVSLPTDAEIEGAVKALIDRTGIDVLNIALTLDHAKSSFAKIRMKQPPSHKREQFADGVIWAHCVDLLDEADVYLVTNDKAFYRENNANTSTLAPNLYQESRDRENQLTIYPNLERLMDDIRTDVKPDDDVLLSEFRILGDAEICALLEEHQFALGPAKVLECDAFITETADQLYVQATVCWQPLVDESVEERSDARLSVVANGKFETDRTFSEGRLENVTIDYTDTSGEHIHRRKLVVHLSSLLTLGGPSTERHSLRVNVQDV